MAVSPLVRNSLIGAGIGAGIGGLVSYLRKKRTPGDLLSHALLGAGIGGISGALGLQRGKPELKSTQPTYVADPDVPGAGEFLSRYLQSPYLPFQQVPVPPTEQWDPPPGSSEILHPAPAHPLLVARSIAESKNIVNTAHPGGTNLNPAPTTAPAGGQNLSPGPTTWYRDWDADGNEVWRKGTPPVPPMPTLRDYIRTWTGANTPTHSPQPGPPLTESTVGEPPKPWEQAVETAAFPAMFAAGALPHDQMIAHYWSKRPPTFTANMTWTPAAQTYGSNLAFAKPLPVLRPLLKGLGNTTASLAGFGIMDYGQHMHTGNPEFDQKWKQGYQNAQNLAFVAGGAGGVSKGLGRALQGVGRVAPRWLGARALGTLGTRLGTVGTYGSWLYAPVMTYMLAHGAGTMPQNQRMGIKAMDKEYDKWLAQTNADKGHVRPAGGLVDTAILARKALYHNLFGDDSWDALYGQNPNMPWYERAYYQTAQHRLQPLINMGRSGKAIGQGFLDMLNQNDASVDEYTSKLRRVPQEDSILYQGMVNRMGNQTPLYVDRAGAGPGRTALVYINNARAKRGETINAKTNAYYINHVSMAQLLEDAGLTSQQLGELDDYVLTAAMTGRGGKTGLMFGALPRWEMARIAAATRSALSTTDVTIGELAEVGRFARYDMDLPKYKQFPKTERYRRAFVDTLEEMHPEVTHYPEMRPSAIMAQMDADGDDQDAMASHVLDNMKGMDQKFLYVTKTEGHQTYLDWSEDGAKLWNGVRDAIRDAGMTRKEVLEIWNQSRNSVQANANRALWMSEVSKPGHIPTSFDSLRYKAAPPSVEAVVPIFLKTLQEERVRRLPPEKRVSQLVGKPPWGMRVVE